MYAERFFNGMEMHRAKQWLQTAELMGWRTNGGQQAGQVYCVTIDGATPEQLRQLDWNFPGKGSPNYPEILGSRGTRPVLQKPTVLERMRDILNIFTGEDANP